MFLGRIGRFARPAARRFTQRSHAPHALGRRFKAGLAFGAVAGFSYAILQQSRANASPRIQLETPQALASVELQPPTKSDVFPDKLQLDDGLIYQCLGTGVRTVTFLQLHVYAVGMYLCTDDFAKVKDILRDEKQNYKLADDASLAEVLKSDSGTDIINRLLDAKARFAVRMVPVRNTDFNHMRDGMISNIMNRPEAKQIQDSAFGEGIKHLKQSFGRKGKFPKGNIMIWACDTKGNMDSYYGTKEADLEHLCKVENADVSRMFFLQYLSGPKPNSPTLKEAALTSLANMA